VTALSTLASRLRHRVPHLSCAMIRSGTSRFIVLLKAELPIGKARAKLILDLLAKAVPTDGVGGRHYQSNKVAVLGPGRGEASFVFHFYQVVPEARRLYSNMECSNAASSSGLAAMLLGMARPNHLGTLHSINVATSQTVEVVPPTSECWEGDWGVRFTNLHHLWSHMTQSAQPFRFRHRGLLVTGAIVRHGNIFVMTELPVAKATPELVNVLSQRGEAFAKEIGHPATLPKVFVYKVTGKSRREIECDAVCFSEGQQHHSLPGSGAMALGSFLTARNELPLPLRGDNARTTFRFTHPSGSLTARVHLSRASAHWQIHAASFETPVRLLMFGNLIRP
jgi:2-methylaconitate cis-trans-isomerase PrpF